MKAWLMGGPLDGATIDVPALPERMEFWVGGFVIEYAHEGPPDEPDQSLPEPGNTLHYVE